MCGIVGYIGKRNCVPILLEGLSRLEYRGYDSAGIALIQDGSFFIKKQAGKVSDLVKTLKSTNGSLASTLGIGHTRWATHGEPNDVNAHPHFDCKKEIAVIHNGIVENFASIKTRLLQQGHHFTSADGYRSPRAPDRRDALEGTRPYHLRAARTDGSGRYIRVGGHLRPRA